MTGPADRALCESVRSHSTRCTIAEASSVPVHLTANATLIACDAALAFSQLAGMLAYGW
jgi:hypothetical protein